MLITSTKTEKPPWVSNCRLGSSYVGNGEACGGLAPADTSKTGLVLHDAVGDAHLAAQGGKEQHKLEGVEGGRAKNQ